MARIMLARLVLIPFAVLAMPAAAQAPGTPSSFAARMAEAPSLEGSWALKIDETTIFRFDLKPTPAGWSGTWSRPRLFASNGAVFSNVTGPPVAVAASKVEAIGEWAELTFDDPRPGAVPDVFRLRALAGGKVEAIYVGTGFPPLVLEKVNADTPLGPWTATRFYQRAGVTAAPGAATVTFSVQTAQPALPSAATAARPTPTPPSRPPAVEGR